MPNCIINGCKSSTGKNCTLYSVPNVVKYPELAILWVRHARVDVKEFYEKATKPCLTDPKVIWDRDFLLKNKQYRVCGKHFKEECFEVDLQAKHFKNIIKKKLIHGSYPSIFDSLTTSEVNIVNECQDQGENFEEPQTSNVSLVLTATIGTQTDVFFETKTTKELHLKSYVDCGTDAFSDKEVQEWLDQEIEKVPKTGLDDDTHKTLLSKVPKTLPFPVSTPKCKRFSTLSFADEMSPISAFNISNASEQISPIPKNVSYYEPSFEESDESINESSVICKDISAKSLVKERKYIVFESELDNLLQRLICQNDTCLKVVDSSTIRKSENEGSQLTVWFNCLDGHDNVWKSQPMLGKMPCGNLLIASSILLSGATYHRVNTVFEYMGLKNISKTTYYSMQRQMVVPEINLAWQEEQYSICDELLEREVIKVSGDGRCDSPGHSAKYGTYTLMDQETNQVIHFEIVQKSEVEFKSNNMELEGLKRCLDIVKKSDLAIDQLTTDRHIQIRKYLREEHPNINHQFDVWHLNKKIRSKLNVISKKKENSDLKPWIKTINRHLWYCSEHCEGDSDKLVDMWKSLMFHVINQHEFPKLKYVNKCGHRDLSLEDQERKKWLDPQSDSYFALGKIVNDKKLQKDIRQINEYSHTSVLESYHSLMNKYCSKQQDFDFDIMEARTQLAALDHNFNVGRKTLSEITTSKTEKEEFAYYYSKATGEWHARPLKEPKSYYYIYNILENILNRQMNNIKKGKEIRSMGSIAPISRPDKTELVSAAKRRRLDLN